MEGGEFQTFLSQVASRLRHDLKGGLITLKMGLESLPDEEALKPLLLEKSQELVDLSDKLVLLLRMGQLVPQKVRPTSLFQQAAIQAQNLYSPLEVVVQAEEGLESSWWVDPDAVTYAVLEICQNSLLAGAKRIEVHLQPGGQVSVRDDGHGVKEGADSEKLTQVGVSFWDRSGLGLAVVERCMEEHSGSVELEAGETGFTLNLKFADQDLEESS
jgi:signal transduction histidine kinase